MNMNFTSLYLASNGYQPTLHTDKELDIKMSQLCMSFHLFCWEEGKVASPSAHIWHFFSSQRAAKITLLYLSHPFYHWSHLPWIPDTLHMLSKTIMSTERSRTTETLIAQCTEESSQMFSIVGCTKFTGSCHHILLSLLFDHHQPLILFPLTSTKEWIVVPWWEGEEEREVALVLEQLLEMATTEGKRWIVFWCGPSVISLASLVNCKLNNSVNLLYPFLFCWVPCEMLTISKCQLQRGSIFSLKNVD